MSFARCGSGPPYTFRFEVFTVATGRRIGHSVSSILSSNRNVHENETGRIGSQRLDDLWIHIWIQFLEALCTTERIGNISNLVVTVSNTLTWISISSWITGSIQVDVEGFFSLGRCVHSQSAHKTWCPNLLCVWECVCTTIKSRSADITSSWPTIHKISAIFKNGERTKKI